MCKIERAVIIFNIPTNFGGSDLRRFFTTFTEAQKFECFHYKRRPEGKLSGFSRNSYLEEESTETASEKNVTVAVLSKVQHVQPFLGMYNISLIPGHSNGVTQLSSKYCSL